MLIQYNNNSVVSQIRLIHIKALVKFLKKLLVVFFLQITFENLFSISSQFIAIKSELDSKHTDK